MQTTDYYVLRRPLLAIDAYFAVQQQLAQGHTLVDVMRDVYQNPLCQEGIYYASPGLYAELTHWLAGSSPTEKLLSTLYKYFIRMATRSTPFGLFAGVSVGKWGTETRLTIDRERIQRNVRLDTNYVSQLTGAVDAHPLVRMQLSYSVNATLWPIADTVRFIGYSEQEGQRSYYQNEIHQDAYLSLILKKAQHGQSFQELVELLTNADITPDAATGYIHSLIDNQVLVSELGVNLTGSDPLERLLSQLRALQDVDFLSAPMARIQAWLQAETIPAYGQIDARLRELIATKESNVVQCDTLFPNDQLVLSEAIRSGLVSQLTALTKLNRPAGNALLDTFKRRFFARYENQAVPLLLALDPDVGIGYADNHELPASWLDRLPWGQSGGASNALSVSADAVLRLYAEAARNQQRVVNLTSDDLDALASHHPASALPASAYVLGSFLNETDAKEPLFVLKAMGGPSAANLLGRFAHTTSDLTEALQETLRHEQAAYPDAVLAELVHLPESRTGNVLRRPVLRSYEIPVLTSSTVLEPNQLPLNDLLVSVPHGQQVVLWSKKLQQRVIPRLSTAHHVQASGLAHYRFLYDIQHQADNLRVAWDWGLLKTMPFLPRVQYENVILHRSRWYFTQTDIWSDQRFEAGWLDLKHRYNIPRFVVLAEADNELVLDTDHPASLAILQQAFKKEGQITLFEWLEETIRPLTRSADGQRWCHEFVIPLTTFRHPPVRPSTYSVHTVSASSSAARQFPPGSEWCYVKIYAGAAVLDELLTEKITALLNHLNEKRLFKSWFFIRYADPEKHLRLRFRAERGQETALLGGIGGWANTLMATDKRIHRVQFDTYVPEIERFGPYAIEACENWFSNDSQSVLDILATPTDSQPEWERLRIGCLAVHRLLIAWQFDHPTQLMVVENWRNAFLQEFQADKNFQARLNELFREYKPYLTRPRAEAEPQLINLLTDYQQQAERFFNELSQIPPSLRIISTADLLPHISHLFINRLFADSQRKHELTVYSFLFKLLKQWKAID
ncbi:lantibiotic dehydratase [Spirosoma sp. KNUC1025]|uniref:lantibiotic dehydratase n=1 Tax=Spirosoma sp. KNUC1025 TaxID=2894082 RepID=UPI003870C9D8|nr:lantibiotic dehydratase [Spirosoma sp. KNUC1025]